MTVVVFIESQDGVIKKASLEAISYGRSIAHNQGHDLIGVGFSTYNFGLLSRFRIVGVSAILFSLLFLFHEQSSKYRTI